MKKLNPDHVAVMKRAISQAPYMDMLGMKTTELDYGVCRLEATMERKFCHAYGSIHGGMYASLIDTAAYWASYCHMPEDVGFLSADLNINYFAAVTEGPLYVEGKTVKTGRTLCLAEGTVKDKKGRILAQGYSKMIVSPNLLTAEEGVKSQGIEDLPPKFLEEDT